ncbi:MAG: helix-hairpin-helix domain-containing protein [Prevotella sp.]|nr:helix-hairpin-helix domain-containing protein [Prevotella sp.]
MIREFFYLQKSDRKVIITLLCVIVIALGVIFLTGGENGDSNALTPADTLEKDTLRRRPYYHRDTVYVRTKVVYRDRQGYAGKRTSSHSASEPRDFFVPRYPVKIHEGEHVILNTADTTALKTVPGIGPYFARKIVQYGERLGGYVSVDQLDEIEDFPLESKRYLVIQNAQPRQLNINQLSLNELKRHPYINYYQARAITDYRRLHGPIQSLDDLRLSKDFPPEAIDRLKPYVAY